MREAELPVTFQPSGRAVFVLPGTRLIEAAVSAGLIVDSPCGGEGICGKCRVRMISGGNPPTQAEEQAFSPQELRDGWRLACQSTIESPSRIEIPDASLLTVRHLQVCTSSDTQAAAPSDDPPVRKHYLELPLPSRGCDEPDLLRLEKAIGPFEADLNLTRELAHILRKQEFRGTAVLAEKRQNLFSPGNDRRLVGIEAGGEGRCLLDFEPGNTENAIYSAAVDIGTTTVAAQLLDISRHGSGAMHTLAVGMMDKAEPSKHVHDERGYGAEQGAELEIVSRLNPQTALRRRRPQPHPFRPRQSRRLA